VHDPWGWPSAWFERLRNRPAVPTLARSLPRQVSSLVSLALSDTQDAGREHSSTSTTVNTQVATTHSQAPHASRRSANRHHSHGHTPRSTCCQIKSRARGRQRGGSGGSDAPDAPSFCVCTCERVTSILEIERTPGAPTGEAHTAVLGSQLSPRRAL